MPFTLDRLIRDIRDRLILSEADAPGELVESWIDNAELKIWRLARAAENQQYGVISLEPGNVNGRNFQFPDDTVSISRVMAETPNGRVQLVQKAYGFVRPLIDSHPTVQCAYWAIQSNRVITVGPSAPSEIRAIYYTQRTGLTDIDGETMAAEIFPTFYNAYLFGALEDACDYYEYEDRQVKYAAKLQAEIREINESQSVLA